MNQAFTLVVIEGNAVYADSRILAKRINVKHLSFMANITRNLSKIEKRFGKLRLMVEALPSGQKQKYALLTEGQAYFVMTLGDNTDEALDFRADLINDFLMAKQIIIAYEQYTAALMAERNNRFSSPALDELYVIIHRLQREGYNTEDIKRANELMERCLESEQRVIATGRELRSKL